MMRWRAGSTFRACAVLWLAALTVLTTAGCRSANRSPVQESQVDTRDWKTVPFGRAEVRVPADTQVELQTEVNEVEFNVLPMPPDESFDAMWKRRLVAIEAGSGEPDGAHTAVRKRYPDSPQRHQVYFQLSKDADPLVILERWELRGSSVVKGRTEFDQKFLPQAEANMNDVFLHTTVGEDVRTANDFAAGGVVVSLPLSGRESVKAHLYFPLANTRGRMSLELNTVVLKTPGNTTILNGPANAEADAALKESGLVQEVIRKGPRDLAGQHGVEKLVYLAPAGKPDQFLFGGEWQASGVPDDSVRPQIDLVLDSSQLQGLPLLQKGLPLDLWNAISSSLRFRR